MRSACRCMTMILFNTEPPGPWTKIALAPSGTRALSSFSRRPTNWITSSANLSDSKSREQHRALLPTRDAIQFAFAPATIPAALRPTTLWRI